MTDEIQVENSSDVSVPETPATIGTETEVEAPATDNLSANEIVVTGDGQDTEISDLDAEIDKQLDEQLAAKPENLSENQHFRRLYRNKEKEVRTLKKQTPEYSETDRFAIELYDGLTDFDTEKGEPTTRKFAEKLAQKNKDLAFNATWNLLAQPYDDTFSVGHKILEKMGLDPYRIEDLQRFSKGEITGDPYGVVSVPESVPPEVAQAYKSTSKQMRDNYDWMLESDDPVQRQAAIAELQKIQKGLEYEQFKQQSEEQQKQQFHVEVENAVNQNVVETFNTFIDQFRETPVYTAATVSGDPEADALIKESVVGMILNLNEPESVTGRQALKYFQTLGVNVKASEVSDIVNAVIGHIEVGVKAEKGGYADAKANAFDKKAQALTRANGTFNRIFAEAISKFGGRLKSVSETAGQKLEKNGTMPAVIGTAAGASNGQSQPLGRAEDRIKNLIASAK